jgi:hypothetical protein
VFSGKDNGPNGREVQGAQLTGWVFFIMREENNNSRDEQQPRDPIEIQAVAGTTTKRRGESAKAKSISRAISLGFSVLKPWGETTATTWSSTTGAASGECR